MGTAKGIGRGISNRRPSLGGFDSDAQAYFTAVEAAGGSLTLAEKNAIDIYIIEAKGNDDPWWNDLIAWYPMVGGNAAGFAVNAKNPGTFNLTFVNTIGGDFSGTGWTPNGLNSYGRTNILDTDLILNNLYMSYYSRTNVAEDACDIGARDGTGTMQTALFVRFNTLNLSFFDSYNTGAGRVSVVSANNTGYIQGSRRASNDSEIYRNGIGLATIVTSGGTQPAFELYLGARNNAGVAALFSSKETAGVGIGLGLTDAQALADFNAIQTMNTSLSRQV